VSDKSSIKYIISLSIPIFFANLAIPLVGIVDTALMGNSGNKSFLAATSVATSFFSLIFWSFGFLRMGTVGIVSQSYGKEDYKSILNLVFRNLFFVILISLEIVRELPITLILRPFNFETFATTAYISASEDLLEAAAVPSLFLILIASFFIY